MSELTNFCFKPVVYLETIYDRFKNNYPNNHTIYGWFDARNKKWGISGGTKYSSITGTGHSVQYINYLISKLLEEEQHFEIKRIERAWLNLIEAYTVNHNSNVTKYTDLPLKATLPIGKLDVFQIGRAYRSEVDMFTSMTDNVSKVTIESKQDLDEVLNSIDYIVNESIKDDFNTLINELYKNEPYRSDWLKENGYCEFIQLTFNIDSAFDLVYFGWAWEGITSRASDADVAKLLYSGIIINTSKLVNDPDNEPLFNQLLTVSKISTTSVK